MTIRWRSRCFVLSAGAALMLSVPSVQAHTFKEAPMLAEMVSAGKLPPVDERLPINPEVVQTAEIGRYGGTIRRGLGGSNDHNSILRFNSPQGLTRWKPDFSGIVPNVAESFEANDAATEFTFHLREGMKWSDGAPFTADDILFFVNDLLNNEEFYPIPPSRFVAGGRRMQAEKIDDHTVKLIFAESYGTFLNELATPLAQEPVLWARHYCSQFHADYNTSIQADVDATEAVEDWPGLFRLRCGEVESPTRWGNPDRPTLDPWIVTDEAYTAGATQVVLTRNPYFWQVDGEEQQLPYVDTFSNVVAQNSEALLLEALAGNIDMQRRRISALSNKPVLADNRVSGGYEFYDLTSANSNGMGIYINVTHRDPVMREALSNKNVRVALSLGIDREEIIDIIYEGVGEPYQIGPRPEHPLYDETLSRQHTQHDVGMANALLDEAGYDKRDADGYRLLSDGRRFAFNVNFSVESPQYGDTLEVIREQWEEIGIDLASSGVERSIYYSRGEANEHDFMVWHVPGGLDPYLSPRAVLAIHPQASWFAIPWARWYLSGGSEGEEPPDTMKMRYEWYEAFKRTADPVKQAEYFHRIHAEAADQFEVIGISLAAPQAGIRNKNLRNVPDIMPGSWMFPDPGPTLPQTYFYVN